MKNFPQEHRTGEIFGLGWRLKVIPSFKTYLSEPIRKYEEGGSYLFKLMAEMCYELTPLIILGVKKKF